MAHYEMKPLEIEIKRMSLKSGEIVLLDFKGPVSKDTLSRTQTIMNKMLPPGVHYLVLQGDAIFMIVEAGRSDDSWYEAFVYGVIEKAVPLAADIAIQHVKDQLKRETDEKRRNRAWRKFLRPLFKNI